jgi:hypothetical protein|tara:strand:- start:141 stop:1043 length:903 start_codon:yes stop_codon:yes gene_type:complete
VIKLKDLLVEKQTKLDGKTYPAWTEKVLQYVLKAKYVPLTTGIVEKILGKKIPVNAFHATDIKNIKYVKNVLGNKKSLSTFTRMGIESKLATGGGIQTTGGIVFHIQGNLLAKKMMDMATGRDKQGRAWFFINWMVDSDAEIDHYNMRKKAGIAGWDAWEKEEEKIEKEMKKKGFKPDSDETKKQKNMLANRWIVKYIDLSNKWMLKHKKEIKKYMFEPDTKLDGNEYWQRQAWNELLVYNTKIKSVFVLDKVIDKMNGVQQVELEKLIGTASGNVPVVVGNVSQYHKWYKQNGGHIHGN